MMEKELEGWEKDCREHMWIREPSCPYESGWPRYSLGVMPVCCLKST